MEPRVGDSAPMALMQLVESAAVPAAPNDDEAAKKQAKAAPKKASEKAAKKAAPKAGKAEAAPKKRKKAAG